MLFFTQKLLTIFYTHHVAVPKCHVWFIVALACLLSACQSLPETPHLPKSVALTQKIYQKKQGISVYEPQTKPNNAFSIIEPIPKKKISKKQTLAQTIDAQTKKYPNLSGYLPISTGADAFATRSILTDLANETIDVQYYIWHDDEAGLLMLKDLWESAERGVQVRLLLDDMNGNANLDNLLLHFATHPNIAVRIVNPFLYRNARPLNYAVNPIRINRRMHNKSMTYDGKISIIGGRNIGDEYLNNSKNNHFADLDVLLIGKVVGQIEQSFNEYWQSPLAYDIETLIHTKNELSNKAKALIDSDNYQKYESPQKQQALKTYREALIGSTLAQKLLDNRLPFRFKPIEFVSDSVNKLSHAPNANYLIDDVRTQFGTPTKQLSIVSSYFVPTKQGVQDLIALAKSGVSVQILTNSYDATDVGTVHAGYAKWRKELLTGGIKLYELKAAATHTGTQRQANYQHKKDNRLWRTKRRTTTSLHAKLFAIDGKKLFIGSYNIDPRSANLNTELGVLIDDAEVAQNLHNAFNDNLLTHAYEVKLNHGQLEWHTLENNTHVILTQEPNMKVLHKASVKLLSWLKLDWLL